MGGVDVTVKGAGEFDDLARRIRTHADRKALQKKFYSGLNRATKEVRREMKEGLAEGLPQSGGAASVLAGQSGLQARAKGGRDAAIRIVTSRKHDYASLNKGTLRHPVYGNRSTWASQPVEPNLLEERFTQSRPEIQRALQRVMAEVAREVEGF